MVLRSVVILLFSKLLWRTKGNYSWSYGRFLFWCQAIKASKLLTFSLKKIYCNLSIAALPLIVTIPKEKMGGGKALSTVLWEEWGAPHAWGAEGRCTKMRPRFRVGTPASNNLTKKEHLPVCGFSWMQPPITVADGAPQELRSPFWRVPQSLWT